ncbi:MAG: cob(I)yrinic acid a,c-diamide adenosyltransferase [Pseudomonadota bacterium]|uniref:cob(I)yrinic acid a,c-diamide adenosyltransferase n=1 Tax=Qipengyuania flava TaxID=192812 RepID=UPI0007F5462A|nr:cob(I)yrinic acid a,c-diamide adenosyltransferase [Qipengyuania flava]MEC7161597.1 cob(I)yrinic acid a,c-diamide adenosyltransferase [Pseudomonadota bacterium]OAN85475.1 ATP:cob(I)alamin adenosyltransferase [Erythrobacter sp. EhN03]ASP29199.1 ATP:cob(I)alamin adenosyltransferase [Qipengyuania flava]MEC7422931.1 cob(I)yrinic acid a,c-diamide adenosyltransferase [Pseudomonadota bacterium]MEC7622699.1 cob(I)yrinic acid a,c-diamide adenosyltransferase [Pseudomonadota bacterium]
MVKLNKIYTRTGDAGTTGLVDGSRLPKHDVRMEAIGAVDEANSALGLAAAILGDNEHAQQLFRIQNDLFDLGADLATPATEDDDFAPSEMVLRMVAAQTEWLEQAIDAANANLEPLTSFVLPGGSEASARLHLARAATRRAERAMTAMAEQLRTNPQALAYINRLSDYLFVLARTANDGGRSDIKWVPGANR